jgi:Zn-dependent protease
VTSDVTDHGQRAAASGRAGTPAWVQARSSRGGEPRRAGTPLATAGGMYKLGRVAGIEVQVHWTFLLLLLWIIAGSVLAGDGLRHALAGVVLVALVFASVVLHELGQALVARRYGVRTRSITLLLIGGVAAMDRMPERPRHELLVALAGPAVNVAIAALLLAVVGLLGLPAGPAAMTSPDAPLVAQLLWINVSLAVFNLLPAFPMDGGRALRALLAVRHDPVRATALAAAVGRVMAVAMAIAGVLLNPMLILIAGLIWFGGRQEARAIAYRAELAGLVVEQAMLEQGDVIAADDSLRAAATCLLSGAALLPVVDADLVVGMLTETDLARALDERGPHAPARSAMLAPVAVVDADAPLADVLDALTSGRPAVVRRGSRVVGVLTPDSVQALTNRRRIARALGSPPPDPGRDGEPTTGPPLALAVHGSGAP